MISRKLPLAACSLIAGIFILGMASITPASSGILTLDISGTGVGTLSGNPFSSAFSFHLVGPDNNGGCGDCVNLTTANATIAGLATTVGFSNPMRIGLNFAPNFAYFGYAIDGSQLLQLFFSGPDFALLNSSNSFAGLTSTSTVLNGFTDVPTSGGNLTLSGFSDEASLTAVSAVPELSTWVMMLLGFAGIGFVAYRRAKKAVAVIAH